MYNDHIIINRFMKMTDLGPGFGDYLRGSIYLYKLSKKYGFKLLLDMSHHPVSKYLDINIDLSEYSSLETKDQHQWYALPNNYLDNMILELLKKNKINCIFVTDPYHNFWHNHIVDEDTQEFMKSYIKPTVDINMKVNNLIETFRLTNNKFNILHIRLGDEFLINGQQYNKNDYINYIINTKKPELNKLPLIVLADCYNLKQQLANEYNFLTTDIIPKHINRRDTDLEGTIIEFFLMSRANSIYSVSSYWWGSTFSTMCSAIFNIPLCRIPELKLEDKLYLHSFCKSCDGLN